MGRKRSLEDKGELRDSDELYLGPKRVSAEHGGIEQFLRIVRRRGKEG